MTRKQRNMTIRELKDAIDKAERWIRVGRYGAKPPADYEGEIPPRPDIIVEELANAYNSVERLSKKLLAEIANAKANSLV